MVDAVLPQVPVHQWVPSLPIPLRILLAAHPQLISGVLQIVHRVIATILIKQSGLKRTEANTGAVTRIQRFGSAANLNIHLHCQVLDGVYQRTEHEPVFHAAPAPSTEMLQALLGKIIVRLMRLLTRQGLLIEEQRMRTLAGIDADPALTPLQAASCTYRIAMGPRAGQKVLSLQSIAGSSQSATPTLCVNAHGFSSARVRPFDLAGGATNAVSTVEHPIGTFAGAWKFDSTGYGRCRTHKDGYDSKRLGQSVLQETLLHNDGLGCDPHDGHALPLRTCIWPITLPDRHPSRREVRTSQDGGSFGGNSGAEIVAEVKAAIAANDIVVVGMKQNPFPKKARKALDEAGLKYTYLEYGSYFSQWHRRLALKMWTGWPTIPMVFVKGVLVGGAQDLERLIHGDSDQLKILLRPKR